MTDRRTGMSPYTPEAGSTAREQAGAGALQSGDPGRIGPYAPLGVLGSGGMGRVFLARPHDDSPGLAAVKVIRSEYAEDPEFRRRFEREAAVHARVRTAYAPQLLGTGFDDSLLWMATEYLPGLDLAQAVRECGPLDAAGVWRLVEGLGNALTDLAAAGVVHRDLKPSNVILTLRGVHLIDFGISQAADSSAITTTGSRVGTPAFMAPEYLREGRCEAASDVFSLAGTVIYAATGYAPFGDGTGVDVMHRVAFEAPKSEVMEQVAAVDPALAGLLSACLAKEPAQRPTSAQLAHTAQASGHLTGPSWPQVLTARLGERQQAYEVLARATVQETGHFRAPTHRVAPAAPGPGFGPPTPATPHAAYGAPVVPGPQTPPGSFGPQTPPGSYGAAPVSYGPQTPPGSYGQPTPPGAYAPRTPPGQYATPAPSRTPARRRVHLAVVASVAVVAVAVGAFVLTRPGDDDGDRTAADRPVATGSASHGDDGDGNAPPLPGDDGESARPKDTGKAKDKEDEGGSGTSGGSGAEETKPADGGGDEDPDDGGATGGSSGSGSSPDPAPTKTATKPATPPWISQCTYYSGTAQTEYGDTGQRVVQVQCMLTKRGYSTGAGGVDGEFGPDTRTAVKRFQTAKGLDVDGEVGPNTWAALRSSS
ncbi:protein kinase [Streptomyces sp. NPDC050418]|uniref:protein kinase domain-containing protein n=1 Tax=Streptomyces sp. NPDC050418 TaxID=3365612 RepID=UPI0037B77EB2